MAAQNDRDLYRLGNTLNARFDEILPRDVTIHNYAGAGYVRAGQGEGVSTIETMGMPPPPKGKWWRLPKGSIYDDSVLILVSDPSQPGHWQWEPRWDMHVDTYRAALSDLQVKFIPMWHKVGVAIAKGPLP